MNTASRAVLLVIALAVSAIACTTTPHVIESWAADFLALQETLFMNFERTGNAVQGSGTVTPYLNFNVVQLSLTGTRTADTLDITYVRPDNTHLHFLGRYVQKGTSQVIDGILSGGEFNNTITEFQNH